MLEVARPHDSPIGSEEFRSVAIADDCFGWYLHLAVVGKQVLANPLAMA